VRDALLQRTSDYLDLDFVLPEAAVETARVIARHHHAGFVLLDADRQIARVVFPQGTADFAQQVGHSLEDDLQRRDFRANAIAYNPHTACLIDPLQGCQDLQHRILRMVSPENLAEDPLRLLRAYRQAAQLGFNLDPATRQVIQQLAPQLGQVAAERVQSELNYLLSSPKGTVWLQAAWEDGLLRYWLPETTWPGLERVSRIDRWISQLKCEWRDFASQLCQPLRGTSKSAGKSGGQRARVWETPASGSTRTCLSVAKLACLLPPDPDQAEAQLWRLKYSRAEVQAVGTVLRYLPQLQSSIVDWTLAEQYYFFQGVGPVFPAVAISALAAEIPLAQLQGLIQRFLDPQDQVAHPTSLLTGQDLMQGLGLSPSPHIGRLLADLQLARAEGRIKTPQEALALAQTLASPWLSTVSEEFSLGKEAENQ
jgi:tRNA nucleotidyltransferase (CCA-adding enzyme)